MIDRKNCDKEFSSRSSVHRHMNTSCKRVNEEKKEQKERKQIYNDLKNLKEANEKLMEKVIKLEKNQIKAERAPNAVNSVTVNNGNVNNGTINNSTVNVMISFGKEDMSKIDASEMLKAIKNGFNSTIELTDTIHFNPKYPKYHNVYIPSMKDKYAMVFNEGNWELINKQDLIDRMYDNKKEYIEDNIELFYDAITQSQKNALRRWLSIDDDDDEKIKNIKERMKLLLYNKRYIPLNTKNNKLLK